MEPSFVIAPVGQTGIHFVHNVHNFLFVLGAVFGIHCLFLYLGFPGTDELQILFEFSIS